MSTGLRTGFGHARRSAPWHLWVVGGVSLLWNAFGVYDFVMTQLRDPAYLAHFPADMVVALDTMPDWALVAWALGVWASLAGSLLLLLRSRYAQATFAFSLLGALGGIGWQFTDGFPPPLPMALAVIGVIAALCWYATEGRRRGWLA